MSSDEDFRDTYNLSPLSELRLEIESKNVETFITLQSGFAEVFGTELVRNNNYKFKTGTKLGIFTFQGCKLKLSGGEPDVLYISKETPMVMYLNCHSALESCRIEAANKNERGPIVMVVGPIDVGKSTLSRIFLNYATRQGRKMIYCDIDVGQGAISVPGTIATIIVERPATLEDGFAQKTPLVYHYGDTGPGANITLYRRVVSAMATKVLKTLDEKPSLKSSGIIINTCGWVRGGGYQVLVHAAKAFQATHIFVLDQERLYNELKRDMPSDVYVVMLPKSGGVVQRTKEVRFDAREARIKEYFYGGRIRLYPFSVEVKFRDLNLYKIGGPPLPDSCMPLGMRAKDNKTKLVSVNPSPDLMHHLLTVTFAKIIDEEVIDRNVAGFLCVTNVDMERQTVTVLSPLPRPLPTNIMLLSELQFVDTF